MALQGYMAKVKTQSTAIAFTDEATTTSDNKTYQIAAVGKRTLDYNTDIVVKDGLTAITDGFRVNRIDGKVIFNTAQVRTIKVSGKYVTLSEVASANEFAFDGTCDMGDVSVFQNANREYLPTLISATATIGKFYDIDGFFVNSLFDGSVKVFELYADPTDEPFRFYGIISGDSIGATVEGLITESVSVQVTDTMIVEA